jgi:hypothetical protein
MYTSMNPDKKRVTFGKHKEKIFAPVYTMKHYVKWVLDVVNASGKLRELQEYFCRKRRHCAAPGAKEDVQNRASVVRWSARNVG